MLILHTLVEIGNMITMLYLSTWYIIVAQRILKQVVIKMHRQYTDKLSACILVITIIGNCNRENNDIRQIN